MQISAYNCPVKRRPGELVPFEAAILAAALEIRRREGKGFFGFQLAKALRDRGDTRNLTGYGTVYRALGRLEQFGSLTSRWEDASRAIADHRPPRRMYKVTTAGERALAGYAPPEPVWRGRSVGATT